MRTGFLELTIDVAAPAGTVWAYVTDWERQGEWIPATRVRRDGEEVVARTAIGPLGFDDRIRVTGWDPPRRCDVLHVGRLVRGPGWFEVVSRGPGWRFTWGEQAEVPGGPLAPVLWALALPFLRVSFALALRRMRARVERGGSDDSPASSI